MEFFYSTPAGKVDFYVIMFCCVVGGILGRRDIKCAAAIIVGQFLLDRVAVAMFDRYDMAVVGAWIALASIVFGAVYLSGKLRTSFVGLQAIDLCFFIGFLCHMIEDWLFTSGVVCVLALQLLLILGGGIHGGYRRLGRLLRNVNSNSFERFSS